MKKCLGVLFLLAVFANPAHAQGGEVEISGLQGTLVVPVSGHVTLENPTPQSAMEDANRAASTGKYEFLAVYGRTMECPGVDLSVARMALIKYGVKIVDGTGNTSPDSQHMLFNRNAHAYAVAYNQAMMGALHIHPE